MTPEQLEIIRKKFEENFPTPNFLKYNSVMDNYEIYKHSLNRMNIRNTYNSLYTGFITAMSQEIDLPIITNSPMVIIALDEIKKSLESQGYTVKS